MKKQNSFWLAIIVAFLTTLIPRVMGYTEHYIIRSDAVGVDKWFGTYYIKDGRNDDVLKVGGWGDGYFSLVKMPVHFNVPGRKVIRSATLNLQSFGSLRPTSMKKYLVLNSWSETSTTDHWDLSVSLQGSIPAPPVQGNYGIPITSEFFGWITGANANNGIMLVPENIDNRFNYFLSSENSRGHARPSITVAYEKVPDLKIPLPGDYYWRCNVGAGGSSTHMGANYYAIDFSYRHIDPDNPTVIINNKTDIPILAAAAGVVIETGNNENNGNYVIIDHDKDRKFITGYQTVYLHMKNGTIQVSEGDTVSAGRWLGIMGTTGDSTGVHLHFQVYFEHRGSYLSDGDNQSLNFIRLGGRPITDYVPGSFYQSENDHWSF